MVRPCAALLSLLVGCVEPNVAPPPVSGAEIPRGARCDESVSTPDLLVKCSLTGVDRTHLLSVWGSAPEDVYIVGGRAAAADGGFVGIWHYDGAEFHAVDVAGPGRAWWVSGTDRDHVFVVGEGGLGLVLVSSSPPRFEPFDTGTHDTIFGLWAARPDLQYFVSGDFTRADGRGQVHVRSGTVTRTLSDPALDEYEGRAFFKVWGTGPEDVFVGGELGTIYHFDGRAWSRMPTPSDRVVILTLSGRSSEQVWAVGGRGAGRGVIWRRDGLAFEELVPAGQLPGLMGVHTGAAAAAVAGEDGFWASLDGDEVVELPRVTDLPLHGVWTDPKGTIWAVGGNLLDMSDPPSPVLLRKKGHECPPGAISAPGYHHLDLQGRGGRRRDDGTYPMFDVPRGSIHETLRHGEHYLAESGSFVEFAIPLCADLDAEVGFRLPNNDSTGSVARHELFVVREGTEVLVAEAVDAEPGNSGYIPFDRSSLAASARDQIAQTITRPQSEERGWQEFATARPFETPPRDLRTRPGDTLLFRSTSLADVMYGLMIWYPRESLEYQSFVEVHVPPGPGGEPMSGSAIPTAGPCSEQTRDLFLELGTGTHLFESFPATQAKIESGPQGSLMLVLSLRARGFDPGNPTNATDPRNPWVAIQIAKAGRPQLGAALVADGVWRRGFSSSGEDSVLLGLRATAPDGVGLSELEGPLLFAEAELVSSDGVTLCTSARLTAANAE